MRTILGIGVLASLAWAAAIPTTRIQGNYIEARTADVFTAACHANSEVGLTGNLALVGWKIDQGSWQGVRLDGLAVVGVVRANSTLGDIHSNTFPVKSVLIVDERASFEQSQALIHFAQRMGGDLFQHVVRIGRQPISLKVDDDNVHTAGAALKVGSIAEIRTRAIGDADHLCHNEGVWYTPLAEVGHAMPAYTLAFRFQGAGLGVHWSSPDKRNAYVANFHYQE
ncbi:MAG: DUF1326 domain-containing protein [Acidobacteriota bacterium]